MMSSEGHWEALHPLEPIHFFALSLELNYCKEKPVTPLASKYLLPSPARLYKESPFAEVAMGWHETGIFVTVTAAHAPVIASHFQEGDSLELFFDTRDIKNSHGVHKFCHHFFFLPLLEKEEIEAAGEITRFSGEEKRPLADPHKLQLFCEKKKGYRLSIFIPSEALFGYDPTSFDRLGFTYRINRSKGESQYFALSAKEFTIEEHPELWASLNLLR